MNNRSMKEEAMDFLRNSQKVTLLLAFLNILVFIILSIRGNTEDSIFMLENGAAFTPLILEGQYWRLLTSMFLHFGLQHLLYNMLSLIMLGNMLEAAIGSLRFTLIYFTGGLAGNLLSTALELRKGDYAVSAGASGAIFAIIGACCYLSIRNHGTIHNISTRRIGLFTALMLIEGFTTTGIDNAAHIGGIAAGFLLAVLICHGKRVSRT